MEKANAKRKPRHVGAGGEYHDVAPGSEPLLPSPTSPWKDTLQRKLLTGGQGLGGQRTQGRGSTEIKFSPHLLWGGGATSLFGLTPRPKPIPAQPQPGPVTRRTSGLCTHPHPSSHTSPLHGCPWA